MTAKPVACVIGWPIEHSRSPLIHRFWLARHGIAGDYVRKAVPPGEAAAFLRNLAVEGCVGANVTIPHKEAAFAAVDRHTDTAARLGAVNTVWTEEGAVWGDNSDVHGFLANLDDGAPGWDGPGSALVIGAGGAARAVIFALISRGLAPVHVLNRTKERAVALADHFGYAVLPGGLDAADERLSDVGLVVNTAAAGLDGAPSLTLDWRRACAGIVATDIVYVPLVTPFLADAAAHGARTVDGLGMLLHQAVPGFERWFGVRPSVDAALRHHVASDLGA